MRHSYNKRFALLVIFAVVAAFSYAQTKWIIHVATAGTLPNFISEAEKYDIEELTLTGELNGTDFRLLRDMAGNNYQGQVTNGKLARLHLSDARIVEGGDRYLDAERIYNPDGGWEGSNIQLSTKNDVLGDDLFKGCHALQEIDLPQSITGIGEQALYGTSLKSLLIPENVSSLGWNIVTSEDLASISVDENNGIYNSPAGSNAVFKGNTLLLGCKNTVIPEGITEIGSAAFRKCSGLTSITFPSSLEIIGSSAFVETGLKEISFPQSLKEIRDEAFWGCNSLVEVYCYAESVPSVGLNAFSASEPYITSATLHVSYDSWEDYKSAAPWSNFKHVVLVDEVQIDGLWYKVSSDKREASVLEYKDNVKYSGDIVIPNKIVFKGVAYTVTEIDVSAFIRCTGLTSVMIPNSVVYIGSEGFFDCSGLKSVTIGSSVKGIGDWAFWGCSSLVEMYCYAQSVPAVGLDTFWASEPYITSATLYVPSGSLDNYKSKAPWSEFKNIVLLDEVTVRTIHVAEAGTLSNYISESEKYLVEELTLTGELNGTDFRLLRDMAGCDYLGDITGGSLMKLDLSGVKIVEGGEKYLDTETISAVGMGGSFSFNIQSDKISQYLFCGCSSLQSLILPNSVTSIENCAIGYCNNLNSIIIPNNVTSIGNAAFSGCLSLQSITIPSSVTSIGNSAFSGCLSLQSITIPSSVTSIGFWAFQNCNALQSITIPSSVTSIGSWAFQNCNALQSITIPSSVTSIGSWAFSECPKLEEILIEEGNKNYVSVDGVLFNKNMTTLIQFPRGKSITTYSIPSSVTTISESAFQDCRTLTYIEMPEGLTSIGDQSFSGCSGLSSISLPNSLVQMGSLAFLECDGLTSISIPEKLESIRELTFLGCDNLKSVNIPRSVKSIRGNAFEWCMQLSSINIDVAQPFAINENVFSSAIYSTATLTVPKGTKDAYLAAEGWNKFTTIKENDAKRVIHVDKAGTLPDLISESDKYMIEELTLTGELNGTDFRLLRDMTGNDYSGHITNGKLRNLDITGANIVAGGAYAEFEEGRIHTQNSWFGGSNLADPLYAKDNCIGAYLFGGCTSLETISLPESVNEIEEGAFAHTNIKSLQIPANVTKIENMSLWLCNKIESISVDKNNKTYTSPEGSNAIIKGSTLVLGCMSTIIPEGITEIGDYAFYCCYGLTSLRIPSSVETIGSFALGGTNLIEIGLPQSLKTIKQRAFYACSILTSFTIRKSVTSIEDGILTQCPSLNRITVEEGNEKYDSRYGCNGIVETATNTLIAACNNTVIPTSVTKIGDQVYSSSNITGFTIPAQITSIGNTAFSGCYNLKEVISLCKTPPSISDYTFQNLSDNAVLKLPYGSLETYKNATGWKYAIDQKVFSSVEETADEYVRIRTIHVAEAGTLSSYISDAEKYQIEELTLTGELNSTDFRLLRDMAGNNYKGELTEGKLTKLDLSGARIVAGGDLYIDTDGIETTTNSTHYTHYGSFHFSTSTDHMPRQAFIGCSLSSIILPHGITELEDNVFSSCYSIKSITLQEGILSLGNNAFGGLGKLNSINIPESVTSINGHTFSGCVSLKKIVIPKNVSKISNNAFYQCYNLKELLVDEDNENYSSVDGVLYNKNKTVLEIFPAGKTEKYVIPEGVQIINSYAFYYNPLIKEVTFPQSLISINSEAFYNCSNLDHVSIPQNVQTINQAFRSCLKIRFFEVDARNKFFASTDGVLYNNDHTVLISYPAGKTDEDFIVPTGVVTVSAYAFDGVENLCNLTFPEGVQEIGDGAVWKCEKLNSLTIPNSLKTIGRFAIVSLNLTSIISYIKEPFEVKDVFECTFNNATLTVPAGTKSLYENTSEWNKFVNIEEGINTLFGSDVQAYVGKPAVLPIVLTNENEVKLCQFDLRLPAGVTVATTSNGKLDANLTERAESHSVSSSLLSNGDYRFVVSSMDNDSFTGNSGTLLEIKLDISETMEIGEYVVKILNSELSVRNGSDWKVVKPADAESGLIIKNYTPGDVNDDGSVSVTDVGCTINYILEKVPDVFIFAAADMNGDKSVSVTDVGMIIEQILNAGVAASRQRSSQDVLNAELSLVPVADGYQLMLNNKEAFVSFQMDIQLANGATINGLKQNDDNHRLTFNKLDDGNYRVVCYSLSNSTFQDDAASLLNISTTGDIIINDIRLTTARFNELRPMALSGTSTGISNVEHGMQVSVQGNTLQIVSDSETTINIYSLGGSICRVLNLHRGVNSIDGLRSGVYMIGNRKLIIR